LLKYFFTHHRMEKVQAAKEEPPRRESSAAAPESRSRRQRQREERPPRGNAGPERPRRPKARTDSDAAVGSPADAPSDARHPMLWINLGKSDGLDSSGLTSAVEAVGAPAGKVRRVSLRTTYSYLVVDEADVAAFEALSGRAHGDKVIRIERAKKRSRE